MDRLPSDITDLIFLLFLARELTQLTEIPGLRRYAINHRYATIRLVDFPLSALYNHYVYNEDQMEAVIHLNMLAAFMRQNSDVFVPNRLQIIDAKVLQHAQAAYPELISQFREVQILNYTGKLPNDECDCVASADFTYSVDRADLMGDLTSLTLEKEAFDELKYSDFSTLTCSHDSLKSLNLFNVSVNFDEFTFPQSLEEIHVGSVVNTSTHPLVDFSYLENLHCATFDRVKFLDFCLPTHIRELNLSHLQPIATLRGIEKYHHLVRFCVHHCTVVNEQVLNVDFPDTLRSLHLNHLAVMKSQTLPVVLINGTYTQRKVVCPKLPPYLESFLLTRELRALPRAHDGKHIDLQNFFFDANTTFPPTVKALVLKGFSGFLDSKGDRPESILFPLNVEHLVVANMLLKTLKDTNIARLSRLSRLSIEGNNLKNLDGLMIPKNVRYLDASHNYIETVSLATTSVQHLCLRWNSIIDIHEHNLPFGLKKLWLESNPLRSQRYPPSLEVLLILGTCLIVSQELLDSLPNLELLRIEHCFLEQNARFPRSLRRLWMSSCHLHSVNFDWPPHLEFVDVSANEIDVDLDKFPSTLRVLHACTVNLVFGSVGKIKEARFNGRTDSVVFGGGVEHERIHTYYCIPNVGVYYGYDEGHVLLTDGEAYHQKAGIKAIRIGPA